MIRPYVTLSCAMSLDGYLDTASPHKLAMSNSDDFDRVDQLRAESDAIMVGASTVRRDNPRLLIRSAARRREREQAGLTSSPIKVTVTATGDLSADAAFFAEGDVEKIVYGTQEVARTLEDALGGVASVVALGPDASMADVLDDLAERGVERLMVEGGGRVLTQFLVDELADELQLVIAPFFVGEPGAPRFVEPARFPWTSARRAVLADTQKIGDVVLLRYALSERCRSAARARRAAAELPARR
ncbi:RibD family protein [Microbacterium sp.]|uniref:RibD family protein n=1 Tax=Microbacterium sp. TaxID=51671 RepID=UPI0037CBBF02